MARGLTYTDRRRELAVQLALQTRFNVALQRMMDRVLKSIMRQAIDSYEKSGSMANLDTVIDDRKPEVYLILSTQYRTIIKTFGKRILDVAKSGGPTDVKVNAELFEDSIQSYINTWAVDKVTLISDTTKDQMRRLITAGLNDELSGAEIAKQIRTQIPSISAVRSDTISRTEVHAAANYANQSAAEATELQLNKEWITFIDGRERESHAAANGQVVDANDDFFVDGESLAYPGDPSGSAGNVINCRCVVGYLPKNN